MPAMPAAVFVLVLTGCKQRHDTVLGVSPAAQAIVTVKNLDMLPAARKVTLAGEMVEKCPVAGCWFMLRDKSGVVRVDTRAAGFVVSDVPLHTHLMVAGAVTKESGPGLAATGIRY